MEYTKLCCTIHPDTEINREILVAELGTIGYESFTETDDQVEAFIPSTNFLANNILSHFHADFHFFDLTFTYEVIPDQNWNEVWEKNYFKPLLIANRCLIRAPFHTDYPKAEYEIVIEPGMAFGTGNHETTSLMISEILEEDLKGKAVLDMGCGTGILSILASFKGAARILGVDIDSWAIKSTMENAAYNHLPNLEVIQGGAEVLSGDKFDFIYANIQRNILLNDMPQYCKVLNRNGELVMSGFYNDDLEMIKRRAMELGLRFLRFTVIERWVAVVFTLD